MNIEKPLKLRSLAFVAMAFLLYSGLFGSSAWAARGRPHLDTSLGFNMLLTDNNTLLRGVSLSFDGGDPYGSLPVVIPTQAQLNALATNYGLNAVHLYLEGDSAGANGNNNPIGYNAAACDTLVQRCADAGLYLIITIGCNGKNGQMNLAWSQNFWNFYGPRYKDQTHVIYEAHNEPAPNSLWTWTSNDWNNQIALYHTIRAAAPDTFILLCSFMGFAGDNNITSFYDPRNRANYLAANGVNWANAGMAHHGYESKAGIETAISLIQSSTAYPALLCTEFWPGDTTGQEYNNMYESHHNGWMQFQWLGANDGDLFGPDGFKEKINIAGTVWTPDVPTCNWPAKGAPTTIPAHNSSVGIYDRGASRFVRINGSGDLVADLTNYTGNQSDKFTLERSSMNLISLKATNGLYVSTTSQTDSLTANSATAGVREKFQWIELATGQVVLRAFGGGGHLLRSTNNLILPNADNGLATSAHYTLVDGNAPSGPPPLPPTLPSPWVTADIGAVGAAGSAIYGSGVFTVAGSGADIESNADAFRYVYQSANGDVTIVARVATQQNTDYWAKTGVMIRESTAAGAMNAAVLMTPGGGVVFQRRTSTGGSTASTQASGVVVPRWVRLVRTGSSFSAYHSADGVAWAQIGTSQTINMAASATLGLAVCSHQASSLGESTLDNVTLTGAFGVAAPTFSPAPGSYTGAQSVTINTTTSGASIRYTVDGSTPTSTMGTLYSMPVNISATTTLKAIAYKSGLADSTVTTGVYTISSLSAPWMTVDIGAVGIGGSVGASNGVYTVEGSGTGIAGTADQFRYVYQTLSGDGSITARLVSQSGTNTTSLAGVMIRETTATGSKFAGVWRCGSGSNNMRAVRRTRTGGSVTSTSSTSQTPPNCWVRITRTGNSMAMARSTNGTSWTTVNTSKITMATEITIGLIVTSGNNSILDTDVFDNVAVVP